jgi:hypothetical protein
VAEFILMENPSSRPLESRPFRLHAAQDTKWQTLLGTNRKIIGDFACFVHFILGKIPR